MNALNELNAAIDAILAHTDPAKRNVVRAWLRVVVASAKMIPTDVSFEHLNKLATNPNDNPADRS